LLGAGGGSIGGRGRGGDQPTTAWAFGSGSVPLDQGM